MFRMYMYYVAMQHIVDGLKCRQTYPLQRVGTSGGVMICKLDKQTFTSEFESHWVLYSYRLQSHVSKVLSQLLSTTES